MQFLYFAKLLIICSKNNQFPVRVRRPPDRPLPEAAPPSGGHLGHLLPPAKGHPAQDTPVPRLRRRPPARPHGHVLGLLPLQALPAPVPLWRGGSRGSQEEEGPGEKKQTNSSKINEINKFKLFSVLRRRPLRLLDGRRPPIRKLPGSGPNRGAAPQPSILRQGIQNSKFKFNSFLLIVMWEFDL